jgi:formate hydrogenlyase subunit 3/multisubunit Na+/H+ antiporter MnhD subunit
MIIGAGFGADHPWTALAALALLVVAFGGLLRAAHAMMLGAPSPAPTPRRSWLGALPIVAALALLVLTGVAWPPGLADALAAAARTVAR